MTNDSEVAEKISLLRDHGRNANGDVVAWGLNSRLDNLQAAILDYRLLTYDKIIKRRRNLTSNKWKKSIKLKKATSLLSSKF